MTQPATARRGLLHEVADIVSTVAVPHHEPPSIIRRRRIIVAVVVVIGAVLLGYLLTTRPGSSSFYAVTLALAAVWTAGAFASGPLHLGSICVRGRNQRPAITGTGIGLVLGGLFLLGGLGAREIPAVNDHTVRVLEFANHGRLSLVVLIMVINGIAEELFFRGALYTALGRHYPFLISTVLYVVAVAATREPMLVFAAVILGLVCAFERRATGGVLAPMLTHVFWGLIIVLALPLLFGL
ncbi:MAG: CPBP family intramembrane metalloprotease [Mycobacteriaceae bacterium]|nr:CPBP family intramembrane metalloprotease [Mycobacteriaceae bacterium]